MRAVCEHDVTMAWHGVDGSHRKDVSTTRARYWELSKDDKLQEIKQGKLPEQVALEKAAYLMDAAMLGAEVSTRGHSTKIEGGGGQDRYSPLTGSPRWALLGRLVQGITSWNDVRQPLAEVGRIGHSISIGTA